MTELAKRLILDIASSSQGIICDATEYASRRGFRNVQSSHFRLEKEMQRICVAAEGILGLLSKSSLRNGTLLDDRLEEWFTTDELPACLDTLHQMRKILKDDIIASMAFTTMNAKKLCSSHPEDKINATVKLFDSRRNHFHFLLTTDVWNCEKAQRDSRAISIDACDRLAAGPVDERNIKDVKDTRRNDGSALLNTSTTNTEQLGRSSQPGDSKRLDEILKWLGGLSCAMKQEETLSLRQPDTCTWFQFTPEFESWRYSANSFLWLQGKPGCGKTVLASFVVASLEEKRGNGAALAYFYCDFRNDRSTSAAEVMRSLLSQLLRHIRNNNIDAGELVDDLAREKDSDTPTLNSVKRLVTLLSQAARQFSYQPLVVVDAMDECNDVDKLLEGLLILAKGGMRLFVTSRPVPVIKDGLCGLPSISMDKNMGAVSADIALHVTRELDSRRRLRDLEPAFKMEIHAILCDRADGMFRWVQCQIDTLNRCTTRAEVREALKNLPVGLDETYRRILVAIDIESPEGKLALRALVWLIGALRPLRSCEILEGLTIDLGRRTMDRDTGPMHRGALLDACGSLVTYNEETDILILSHFSVKEYLTGDLMRVELPRYFISYQSAHEQLARFCICYLTLYLKHVHGSADDVPLSRVMRIIEGRSQEFISIERTSIMSTQELLGYVFTDGFSHLAYLGPSNRGVLNDLAALGLDIQRHHDAWEAIYQMSRQHKPQIPWPSQKHDFIFYILIAFSSASLFLAFLRRSRTLLKPKHETNPLVYAAHFGRAQHGEMLLSRGAQVNERGLILDTSRLALPLEIAVKRRQDAIVDLLIFAGSTVPERLFALSTRYYKYPVHIIRRLLETHQFVEWAVEPGSKLPSPLRILEQRPPMEHETDVVFIMRRLVQVEVVDHSEQDSAQRTAIHLAIKGGYKAIMVYLFLIGAPFLPKYISVLSEIAPSEQIPMLRLIVETGVNVDTQQFGEDNALNLAITCFGGDSLEAVRILAGAGCSPLARNAAYQAPLHLALETKNTPVVEFLLSPGTTTPSDAPSAIVESRYPLQWKLETLRTFVNRAEGDIHGITQFEDALFHKGGSWCDPRTRNTASGDTVTSLGRVMDHSSSLLADYLLAAGRSPPPDSLFSILESDLSPAWKSLTIFSLVGKGADIRVVSADGSTLLHATMLNLDERYGLEVTQILAGGGCDPFKHNANLRTPFHFALDRSFSLIVGYLLSLGQLPPADCLFAILHSPLPGDCRARIICSLVEKGVDVSALSAEGNTLLHDAMLTLPVHHGLDVVQPLIDAGCDPSEKGKPEKTLLIAFTKGYTPVIRYLLSKRPDYNWRNSGPILQLLIDNIDFRAADGSTLLHLAIKNAPGKHNGLLDIVKLLVQSGCDPCLCDAGERPPAYFAITTDRPDVVEYLLPKLETIHPKWLKDAIDSVPMDVRSRLLRSFMKLAKTWGLDLKLKKERRSSLERIFRRSSTRM